MDKKPRGKEKLKIIASLFLTFLKIGAFTFGGGYAMIPLIERDMVENKKWITQEEMMNIIAIAESTPGVIALNSATFVGVKVAGFWGAMAASIAVLLPSIIIITLIGSVLDKFASNQYIKWAFLGIRAAVVALILSAVFKFLKSLEKNIFSFLVLGVSLTLALLSSFNVIPLDIVYIILIMAVVGIVYGIVKRKKMGSVISTSPNETEENNNNAQNNIKNDNIEEGDSFSSNYSKNEEETK